MTKCQLVLMEVTLSAVAGTTKTARLQLVQVPSVTKSYYYVHTRKIDKFSFFYVYCSDFSGISR